MESYIDSLLSGNIITKTQQQIHDLVRKTNNNKGSLAAPIEKVPSNISMEKHIPEAPPIEKVPSNLSMEEYIEYMINHDDVVNSESEPEPESESKPEPEPVTKTVENNEYYKKIEARQMRVKNAKEIFERNLPKLVFIIPYRDRYAEKDFFLAQMLKVLENYPNTYYTFLYIHQNDKQPFNRGAMKNIGFLILKNKYPTYYKNMTLVFNDIDVMPYDSKSFNYNTTHGKIKHFYGFKYALGGIFSITAEDFEKTSGFPNVWEWGFEDIIFQNRVIKTNITIDYSQFYPFNDGSILKLNTNTEKLLERDANIQRYNIPTTDGLQSIIDLNYVINEETGVVDINKFNIQDSSPPLIQTSIEPSAVYNKPYKRPGRMF